MERQMIEKSKWIFLSAILASSLFSAGGYFVYVSCGITILQLIGIAVLYGKEKKIKMAWDFSMLSVGTLVFSYLATVLWAVDEGMAIWGFLKFFPVLLFFLLLRQNQEKKEQIIQLLPIFGTLMTIFSVLMMQFEIFQEYVSVAGRLAGFFQYPNTYAVFMLVCIVIAFYEIDWKKPDWLLLTHIIVGLAGILLSGSRIVWGLLAACSLALLISQKRNRKVIMASVGSGVLAIGAVILLGAGGSIWERILSISLYSSTLVGRFLYYIDAIPVILKHPFGLGYYGYYSIQQEIQTGVYSVLNVHNELLQLMLDVGIVPALLFYGCIAKNICTGNKPMRDRVVLLILFLHSLLDYDFQFISMLFVLLLFLENGKLKEYGLPTIAKAVIAVFSIAILVGSVCIGASEYFYTRGDNKKSLDLYERNTPAKVALLTEAETIEEMENYADEILESNSHSAIAYSAKARAAFSRGEIEQFIQYKIKAIDLAPYQYEEYLDYLDCLFFAFSEYQKAGETNSAEMCLKRVESVYGMLEELQERTSSLAWKIDDLPRVTLSHEYQQLLEEAKEALYE